MTSKAMIKTVHSPPPERPGNDSLDETAHTDPGPDSDTPFGQPDWNDAEDRYAMIAEAAYYKAKQRGFELGYEELDWFEAEQELIEQIGQEAVY